MVVHFKFTRTNGVTRRITFVTRPSWSSLSARIASLYEIAIENVGVSYIDTDGDEVTLSSEEELQDFYASVAIPDDRAIKLAVHDLSSLRAAPTASQSLPNVTPQQFDFRNTFGGHEVLPLVFDADNEWQRLPGNLGSLFLSRDAPESPHAFVEVLESDISGSKPEVTESGGGDTSHSDLTSTTAASQIRDKGKGRAATVEDDVSSVASVIGDESPTKPPVHVLEMRSESMFGLSRGSTIHPPPSGVATPAQAQSTPVIPEQTLKAHESTVDEHQKAETPVDDPPLPTLDLPDPDRVSPSLVHDIATLLTTISSVLSAHPELSEHFRSIVTNATNGTYWAAHRNAMSRAAENFHRTAIQETGRSLEEFCRSTEQEASARVTEALGRIFRTAQDGQGVTDSQTSRNINQVSPGEAAQRSVDTVPSTLGSPHLPPHPRGIHHSWCLTPPAPFTPSRGGATPPPPPLPLGNWPRPRPPCFWGPDVGRSESVVNPFETRVAAAEARARANEHGVQTSTQLPSKLEATSEELRTEVERAKADYKARKERYRQAKAIRRMAEKRRRDQESTTESLSRQTSDNLIPVTQDRNVPTAITTATTENPAVESRGSTSEVHIVSNARGRYPQLEMLSVPKRRHTTGHVYRGHVHENENRPFNRIMRKLSDMGFMEGACSNLTAKVMDQLLSHPATTKDAEDDIVTNLIEELIPSGGAHTGGSGGIPGGWH